MDVVSGRVMVFGTFDVFHPGHEYFITEAMKKSRVLMSNDQEKNAASLVVVIARDTTVKAIKPLLRNTESFRQQVIQEHFPEAKVVLGDEEDPMEVVRKYRPELVCLGYDQIGFSEQLRQEYPEIRTERIAAYHPEKYKSSLMKEGQKLNEL